MIILTTLNNYYPNIWERNGRATFSSRYEKIDENLLGKMLSENSYAVGYYRALKSSRQNLPPSLLMITQIKTVDTRDTKKHDIAIDFQFIKKLPYTVDRQLNDIFLNPTPLINYLDNKDLLI